MNSFDDRYRATCETRGGHQGDEHDDVTADGCTAITRWTCCDEVTVVGEIIDCDTCLEPGTAPVGAHLPPGWIEDTNGSHCPRCQPGVTR